MWTPEKVYSTLLIHFMTYFVDEIWEIMQCGHCCQCTEYCVHGLTGNS
jgi:hypothetical protein